VASAAVAARVSTVFIRNSSSDGGGLKLHQATPEESRVDGPGAGTQERERDPDDDRSERVWRDVSVERVQFSRLCKHGQGLPLSV